MRVRLTRYLNTAAGVAGRTVRSLPGVAAAVCGVVGANVLWGAGWAWLTAAGFLLILAVEVN